MFDPIELEASRVEGWIVYLHDDVSGAAYIPLPSDSSLSVIPNVADFCDVKGPDDNGEVINVRGTVEYVARTYNFNPETGRLFYEIKVGLIKK